MNHFSISQFRLYEECPRKYYFQYVLKKFPKPNINLLFGSAFHSALEVYFREGDTEKAENTFMNGMVDPNVELKSGDNIEKEGKIGLRMLRNYFNSPDKPFLKPKEIEYSFQVDLKNPFSGELLDIPIRGIMDLVTEDGFIVDHKTTARIWTPEDMENDIQATCYLMAYETIFEKKPAGFIYNFFIKRVNNPLFDVQATERSEGQMMYFVEYAQWIINQIRAGVFPKKIGQKCRYCPFKFLCV